MCPLAGGMRRARQRPRRRDAVCGNWRRRVRLVSFAESTKEDYEHLDEAHMKAMSSFLEDTVDNYWMLFDARGGALPE